MQDDDDGDSSVGLGSVAGVTDVGYLIDRVYSYLGHDREISLNAHRRGVVALRKACQSEQQVEQRGATKLVFVVLALLRRVISVHGVTSQAELDLSPDDENIIEAFAFQRTLMLTFLLLSRIEANSSKHNDDESGDESDNDSSSSTTTTCCCLWQHVVRTSKKRSRGDDGGSGSGEDAEPVLLTSIEKMDRNMKELDELVACGWNMNFDSTTWATFLHSPHALARTILARGGRLVRKNRFVVENLDDLALRFARATCESFQTKFLCPKNDDDLLSLHASGIDLRSDESISKLQTIALGADSEAGVMTYRDMLCSFLLPTDFIGKRRTLLLGRDASTQATRDFAHVVSLAHDSAMAGITSAFGGCELKMICALLAGLAMLTTSKEQDLLRKSDAFGGVVQLPFLETTPPTTGMRLVLLPSRRTWVLYSLDDRGSPIVHVSKRGVEGLSLCALLLRQ